MTKMQKVIDLNNMRRHVGMGGKFGEINDRTEFNFVYYGADIVIYFDTVLEALGFITRYMDGKFSD